MLEILCESHFGRGWGCHFLCQRNHGLMRWDAKSRASFNLFVYRKGFNTILRSQFQLLSVKVPRQARAQIDHFLGSEARLQKRNNHGFSSGMEFILCTHHLHELMRKLLLSSTLQSRLRAWDSAPWL